MQTNTGRWMHAANAKPQVTAPIRKVLPTVRGEESLAFWKRAFSGLGDISVPAESDPSQFQFYGHSWQLPQAFLQVNGASAMVMSRPQAVIDERPIQQMALHLFVKGSAVCSYNGRTVCHVAGDIVVVDYSMPYEIHTPGYEGIGITFDKASAPTRLQRRAHGLALSGTSSAGAMLGTQLKSLVDHIDGLSVEQAQSAVDSMLRFAETAVLATATNMTQDGASLFERASSAARQQLFNPDFGPNELASALNVSRSKLFRSFAPHGGVQRWLLTTRLQASLHSIVRWSGGQKMVEISSKHGFRSEAHFSRAFSKHYQISPSTVRLLVNASENSVSYLSWKRQTGGAETEIIEAWLASLRPPAEIASTG